MLRFYSPILLLQCFCLYHAHSTKAAQKWFWLIIFFPFIGSLYYLYDHFYNQQNVDTLTDGVLNLVNKDHREEQLRKTSRFSDTIVNRERLADECMQKGKYEEALDLYESCLQGANQDDPQIRMKLLRTHYLLGDYEAAVAIGQTLETELSFRQADERVTYAWSQYHLGAIVAAETTFQALDVRFSNYPQRLEYSRFLTRIHREEKAREKLEELIDEIEHMDRYERRNKRSIYREIQQAYEELS